MVGPYETANLLIKNGINHYDSILTIDSFVTSTHPTHENEAKTLLKMAQTLMMKELDNHISGHTVCVSQDKTEFQKIRNHFQMIWLGKFSSFLYFGKQPSLFDKSVHQSTQTLPAPLKTTEFFKCGITFLRLFCTQFLHDVMLLLKQQENPTFCVMFSNFFDYLSISHKMLP